MSDILPYVKWTPDFQGKWDYDGPLLSISCRYWPANGGFHILKDGHFIPNPSIRKPSASASIILNHGGEPEDGDGGGDYIELRKQEFEFDTEAEVKAAVEVWVATQVRDIHRILAGSGGGF